jgi:hypothetical protein
MAWTDPTAHVYVTGEVVTAATMNTYIKDDLVFLGTPPSCRVYKDSATSITNLTLTSLTFNQERYKTDAAMHSTVSLTGRLIAPLTGKYLCGACITWATTSTVGDRSAELKFNGVAASYMVQSAFAAASNGAACHSLGCVFAFTANQYFEVEVYQESGGAYNVAAGSGTAYQAQDAFMAWVGF